MILGVIGYSGFILSWAIARGAILREIGQRDKARPRYRIRYRLLSSVAVGVVASPIALITAYGIHNSKEAVYGAVLIMVCVDGVVFGLLSVLMPLVHDESMYS